MVVGAKKTIVFLCYGRCRLKSHRKKILGITLQVHVPKQKARKASKPCCRKEPQG
jgi:hypothetical protein